MVVESLSLALGRWFDGMNRVTVRKYRGTRKQTRKHVIGGVTFPGVCYNCDLSSCRKHDADLIDEGVAL
jgi:hypothetical protein